MELEYSEISSDEEIEKKTEKKERRRIPNSVRWKIIGFIDAGKTQKDDANFYHITQGAVPKILKKYKETN
jgi:hypothetical protein